jgi:hydrogenase maturation protease
LNAPTGDDAQRSDQTPSVLFARATEWDVFPETMKKTAIMGFGNPVRSDDGIGCWVIDRLKQVLDDEAPAHVSLMDMGTSAFEVLFQLQGHERIVVVDAVINTGEPDGTSYCLPAEAINASIQNDPMVFLHSLKWDQALSYAKKILGSQYPDDVTVYLIAVSNTRLDIGMSDPVLAAGEQVVQRIKALL